MAVKNLRDAIILSFLKDGIRSRNDIESSLGIQKSIARQSLSFLRTSGFVSRKTIRNSEFYLITDNGRKSIENIYRKLSIG